MEDEDEEFDEIVGKKMEEQGMKAAVGRREARRALWNNASVSD